jgi:signal transduction histidine kinase
MGFLLARDGSTDDRVVDALEIVASVVGAQATALFNVPHSHSEFELGHIWTSDDYDTASWEESFGAMSVLWAEIRAHGSAQLSLDSDGIREHSKGLREQGFSHIGCFPVMAMGRDLGGLFVLRSEPVEWGADPFIFLGVSAGALGNFLSVQIATERLERERSSYQSLVDQIDGALFRTDSDGRIRISSERASVTLGRPEDSFEGQRLFELFDAASRPMIEEKVTSLLSGDSVSFRVFSYVETVDEPLEVEVIARRAADASDGSKHEIVAALFDARPLRRSVAFQAQELKRESLGVMAGGIAHDFNNLLQSMLTSADILAERIPPDDEDYEFIELIRTSGRRRGDQTAQLRAFARGGNPIPRPISIAKIMKQVLDSTRFQGESRVRVSVTISKSLAQVEADPKQMFQVFYNITTNAFEAIEASRGNLSIIGRNVDVGPQHRIVEQYEAKPDRYVEVTFADTGRGISEEDIKRIFDPFFTTKSLGAGLGLAAAHGIIRAHGGVFDVTSVVGQGTTVRVYLPVFED